MGVRRVMRIAGAAGAAMLSVLLAGAAMAVEAAPPTATALLFEAKPMASLAPGSVITYRYDRRSADAERLGGAFSDEVRLTVDAADGAEGEKSVDVDLFTGPRRRKAGTFPAMAGNPLLIVFLETDAAAMQKLTGGNARYFKNRIRAAFRDEARVEPVTETVDGRTVAAEKITLEPFVDDAHKGELGAFAAKRYEFVVSEDVPGGLISLKTTTAGPKPGDVYFEEEIRYLRAEAAR